MIIYNVTIKTDHSISEEYVSWLHHKHLKDMMDTGLFSSYRLCRLIEPADEEGVTFVIQYHCDSVENYQSYIDEHSMEMRRKGIEKFGDKFAAFRTVMEILD